MTALLLCLLVPQATANDLLEQLNQQIASGGEQAENPFSARAEPLELTAGQDAVLTVIFAVPPGATLYQDTVAVEVIDAGGLTLGAADLPPSFERIDEITGLPRQVYELDAYVQVPVAAHPTPGTYTVQLQVHFQGCKDGICYFPATRQIPVTVTVAPATKG